MTPHRPQRQSPGDAAHVEHTSPQVDRAEAATDQPASHGGSSHRWMMIVCCIPMIAIAVGLVATGVAGAGAVLIALACLAMMAMMMVGMGHGDRH